MPPKKGSKKGVAGKRKRTASRINNVLASESAVSSKPPTIEENNSDSGSAFRIILRRTKSPVRQVSEGGMKSPCTPSACSSSSDICVCKPALKCTQCYDPCTGLPYIKCGRREEQQSSPRKKPEQKFSCCPTCQSMYEPCCMKSDPMPPMAIPTEPMMYRVPCPTYKDMPCEQKPAPLINVKYDGCSSEDISLKIKSSHRKPEFDTSKYDVWIIQCPKEFDINNALNRMTTAEGKSLLGDNIEPVIEPYNQMKLFTMFCKVEATPDNLSFIPSGKIVFREREDNFEMKEPSAIRTTSSAKPSKSSTKKKVKGKKGGGKFKSSY